MARGRHAAPTTHLFTPRRAAAAGTLALASTGAFAAVTPTDADAATPPTSQALDLIAKCESGGQNIPTRTYNGSTVTASGYWQITRPTWVGAGGAKYAPEAMKASLGQQQEIATRVYQNAGGFSPWAPSKPCWGSQMGAAMAGQVVAPHLVADTTPVVVQAAPGRHDVPAASAAAAGTGTYTVVRGDHLGRIAAAHGVSTAALYNANRGVIGGNQNLIFPGQVLKLPGGAATPAPATPTPPAAHAAAHEAPLPAGAYSISQGFHAGHNGVDLRAPIGTPIYSVAAGTVTVAGPRDPGGFGQAVYITHDDGTVAWYGHINSWTVHVGQHVRAGDQIATVGSRGNSTGPHLHLEIHAPGAINPASWLAARGVRI